MPCQLGELLMNFRCLIAVLFLLALPGTLRFRAAEDIVFPANAGVVNVQTQYGDWGDGKTDDTKAIQTAIDENRQKARCLYFPNGIYLVCDKLSFGDNLEKAKHLTLQGQSEQGVVLRLKDHAPGFGDPQKKRPLLTMFEGKATGMAFQNSAYNMTFDVGQGNPGAVGLQWMSNNQGSLRNVTIRSSDPQGAGHTGLDLTRTEPGPSLMKFVTVEGFDYAVDASPGPFSTTFEHVKISGQRKAGIRNLCHTIIIRDLKSNNRVPAIETACDVGYFSIIESEFAGGAPGVPAIRNRAGAMIYLRDVKRQGYSKFVEAARGHADVLGISVDEYVSNDATASAAFGDSPRKSLRLAIQETPNVAWDPLDQWLLVDPQKLEAEDDHTDILQEAFDEAGRTGKKTVCLPRLKTKCPIMVSDTLRVPPSVHRVIALDGHVAATPLLRKTGKPVFLVEGDTDEPLVIERMYFIDWGADKNYIFGATQLAATAHYAGAVPGGVFRATRPVPKQDRYSSKTFLPARHPPPRPEGLVPPVEPGNQRRGPDQPRRDLWILSVKTETGGATMVKTVAGGRTEIIGGQNYSSWTPLPVKQPMFIVEDAALSASIFQLSFNPKNGYDVAVRETRGGVTRELSNAAAAGGPMQSYPLITAGKPEDPRPAMPSLPGNAGLQDLAGK